MPLETGLGSTDLMFAEFTTAMGGLIWLNIGAVWAIEKDPNENFTMIRTASEPVMVMESPQEIFARIDRLMQAASQSEIEKAYGHYMGEDAGDE